MQFASNLVRRFACISAANLGMKSKSYKGVKIAFFVFLSQCGTTASWAAQHTTVCFDTHIASHFKCSVTLVVVVAPALILSLK